MKFKVEFSEKSQSFTTGFDENELSFDANMGEIIDLSEGEKQAAYQNGYTKGHDVGFSEGQTVGYKQGYSEAQTIEDSLVTRNIRGVYVNDRVEEVGYDAFRYCSYITEIHLPKVKSTGFRSFANCARLVIADLPFLTNADDQLFAQCSNLTTVLVPLLKSLPYRCFYSNSDLTEIELPSVVHMGTYAFQGCSKLAKLVLSANSVCSISSTNVFTNTPIAKGTGYVYVPDTLVDSYKAAANWTTYADQIKPLSELEGTE